MPAPLMPAPMMTASNSLSSISGGICLVMFFVAAEDKSSARLSLALAHNLAFVVEDDCLQPGLSLVNGEHITFLHTLPPQADLITQKRVSSVPQSLTSGQNCHRRTM